MGSSVSSPVRPASARPYIGRLFVAATGAALALGLLAGAVEADTQLKQSTPIAWDEYRSDCTGGEALVLDAGQMLWYFKLSGAQRNEGQLVGTFATAGQRVTVGAVVNGTMHFMLITNHPETLLGAQTNVDGDELELSHVCAMQVADPFPEPESTPTPKPTKPPSKPQATPKPTATPKPQATPKPTATPKPQAKPRPTRAPQPASTPVDEQPAEPTPAATSEPTAEQVEVPPPTPAATTEPTSRPTAAAVAVPSEAPSAEPEPSEPPLPAVILPPSNQPPASTGLDPLGIVVGAGLLVGLLALFVALRGSLRRGVLERVLG